MGILCFSSFAICSRSELGSTVELELVEGFEFLFTSLVPISLSPGNFNSSLNLWLGSSASGKNLISSLALLADLNYYELFNGC